MLKLKNNFKMLKLQKNCSDKNKRKFLEICFLRLELIQKNQRNKKLQKLKKLLNRKSRLKLNQPNKKLKPRKKRNESDMYKSIIFTVFIKKIISLLNLPYFKYLKVHYLTLWNDDLMNLVSSYEL